MKEIWKDIQLFDNIFQVSNMGNVRRKSFNRTDKRGVVKPYAKKNVKILKGGNNDYLIVYLSANNRRKTCLVHRLVAQAFIPNPENKPCVNHKDGNKENNHFENLEWCTYKENIKHAFETDLIPTGEKHYRSSLKIEDVQNIKKLVDKGYTSPAVIAKELGLKSYEGVRGVVIGKNWKDI